jgi:TP53 regulating kinase-like protein
MITTQFEQLETLSQGAEAKVSKIKFLNKTCILKQRFQKTYRLAQLDKQLTHKRITQEVRVIKRCFLNGIPVPSILHVSLDGYSIIMTELEGITLKHTIYQSTDYDRLVKLMKSVGTTLAKMHLINVIHGDLTTSNIMVLNKDDQVALIDFGLSQVSNLNEDMAVDLYVLERAFLSTHPNSQKLFNEILLAYAAHDPSLAENIKKLDEVRMRGRKRSMIG